MNRVRDHKQDVAIAALAGGGGGGGALLVTPADVASYTSQELLAENLLGDASWSTTGYILAAQRPTVSSPSVQVSAVSIVTGAAATNAATIAKLDIDALVLPAGLQLLMVGGGVLNTTNNTPVASYFYDNRIRFSVVSGQNYEIRFNMLLIRVA